MKAHEKLQQEPFFLVSELPKKRLEVKENQVRYIPTRLELQPDGSYKATEWQARAYGSIHDISKKTGIPRRALMRLTKCGLLTLISPTPFLQYLYYDEIEKFLQKIEANPRYWDEVKTRAYLRGEKLQNASIRR